MGDQKDCAGCGDCEADDKCCVWECDELMCSKHGREELEYWRSYFGIRPGMSKQERLNQLEAFAPVHDISKEQLQEWERL